jgi:hypothetical protein
MRVPAIVGAFPEPFKTGSRGERLAVRLECDARKSQACEETGQRLSDEGVAVSHSTIGAPGGKSVLRVVVGPWEKVRLVREALLVEDGPEVSGVFARFRDDGRTFELLDAGGEVATPPGRPLGLVAATAVDDGYPVWFVSGPDEAGAAEAARLIDRRTLTDAFAVAATSEGPVRLPVEEETG